MTELFLKNILKENKKYRSLKVKPRKYRSLKLNPKKYQKNNNNKFQNVKNVLNGAKKMRRKLKRISLMTNADIELKLRIKQVLMIAIIDNVM